jgi:hypothetical protein
MDLAFTDFPKMFMYVSSKIVTVKVPSGEPAWNGKTGTFSGPDTTAKWGNGFRGGGWDGSAFTMSSSDVNSNITLTITAD